MLAFIFILTNASLPTCFHIHDMSSVKIAHGAGGKTDARECREEKLHVLNKLVEKK